MMSMFDGKLSLLHVKGHSGDIGNDDDDTITVTVSLGRYMGEDDNGQDENGQYENHDSSLQIAGDQHNLKSDT